MVSEQYYNSTYMSNVGNALRCLKRYRTFIDHITVIKENIIIGTCNNFVNVKLLKLFIKSIVRFELCPKNPNIQFFFFRRGYCNIKFSS